MLTLGVFLLRLFGQGMMTHIALTATGRWFSAQRGRAVSLVTLGHQGGTATLPALFASLAAGFGYQWGWVASGVAVLLLGLPLAYLAYRKPRTPQLQAADAATMGPAVRSWTRREVLTDPRFWVLLTGVLAPPFIGTTIFYHQDYLTELRGWPANYYAISLSVVAITTVIFALVSGALIDRFRATTILPFFLLPMSASCFGLASDAPAEALFLIMVLLGISYGFSSTLFGALWPEIYGVDNLGAIRSVTVTAMVLASAAGPGITGTLIDAGIALPTQMVWFGIYCLAAVLALGLVAVKIARSPADAGRVTPHPG
jgi:MFS family permease